VLLTIPLRIIGMYVMGFRNYAM